MKSVKHELLRKNITKKLLKKLFYNKDLKLVELYPAVDKKFFKLRYVDNYSKKDFIDLHYESIRHNLYNYENIVLILHYNKEIQTKTYEIC